MQNYNCIAKYILHNTSNIITNTNVKKKQERYNEDATNAIIKVVLERTYYFNNIWHGTSLGS